ncbi:hypothetical protein AB5J49_46535 [Streptomyces sp. R28]|uniref:Secreted protein n=1 Tax=Streptomyces sp. R28 TaxID=3238628 RepID=A0AB39QBL7_9ACTN
MSTSRSLRWAFGACAAAGASFSSMLAKDSVRLRAPGLAGRMPFTELTDFRTQALARLAAQHEEIVRLREAAAGI